MLQYRKHWQPRKINKPFGVYSRTTINIATGRPLIPRGSSRPERRNMQEYKDLDGNLLPDPAPRIRNIHIGDIIKTTHRSIEEPLETRGRGQRRFISEVREYEVTAIYPYMVQARDRKTGFKRSFSYGELTMMGLEWQEGGSSHADTTDQEKMV